MPACALDGGTAAFGDVPVGYASRAARAVPGEQLPVILGAGGGGPLDAVAGAAGVSAAAGGLMTATAGVMCARVARA